MKKKRGFLYTLGDNFIGYDDGVTTPGERLGSGIDKLARQLRTAPLDTLGSAAMGIKADLDNLMFEGGAMERPEDVLGYAAAPMAPGAVGGRVVNVVSSGGAKPSREAAQEVLDLLKSGRASEVTDDMMAAADDMYLYNNYDLPMDEASRMARAREMGFDTETPLYHGTGVDVIAMDPSARGSSTGAASAKRADWLTSSPSEAGEYADLAQENIPTQRIQKAMDAAERRRDWDEHQRLKMEWEEMDAAGFNGANVMPVLGPKKTSRIDAQGREYFNFTPEINGALRDARKTSQGLQVENLRDAPSGAEWKDPTNHVAVFDPSNIRSRFARFDPRLAHLRNLSAGVGGAAIGLNALPREEQAQIDAINKYLGGL